ncbi:MAG: hypothetical protein JXQ73_11455 [Phycisphaerae bacterium]|nr:hypothetical protein [Phycisphaerae bacterium]
MAVKNWVEVVEEKFPKVEKVSRQMVEAAARQSRLMRGSVRLMTGRLSTSEELEERRCQASKPLLGE